MRYLFLLFLLTAAPGFAQIDTTQSMVAMSATTQRPYSVGGVYYERDSTTPFTGVLYGRYPNGRYASIQEYVDGVGEGRWINYYPDGAVKEVGTYADNRTAGPIRQYYPNGQLRAEGRYRHWRRKVGTWTYYDRNGHQLRTVEERGAVDQDWDD